MNDDSLRSRDILALVGVIVAALLALFGIIAVVVLGWGVVARFQARAARNQNRTQARREAQNQVLVNSIRIGYFQQQLKIAQQQASIRRAKAVGIREAQDEISKTLTPLYVQFEMTEALRSIAASGRNSSVVFIPSGASGIPLVSGANGPRVQLPAGAK